MLVGSCQRVKDFTEFSLQLYRQKVVVYVFAWSFLGVELLFVSIFSFKYLFMTLHFSRVLSFPKSRGLTFCLIIVLYLKTLSTYFSALSFIAPSISVPPARLSNWGFKYLN